MRQELSNTKIVGAGLFKGLSNEKLDKLRNKSPL